MVHFSILLGLFCTVLTQDPGTLDRAESDPQFSCIADLVEKNQSPQRFCPYCEVRHSYGHVGNLFYMPHFILYVVIFLIITLSV